MPGLVRARRIRKNNVTRGQCVLCAVFKCRSIIIAYVYLTETTGNDSLAGQPTSTQGRGRAHKTNETNVQHMENMPHLTVTCTMYILYFTSGQYSYSLSPPSLNSYTHTHTHTHTHVDPYTNTHAHTHTYQLCILLLELVTC